MAVVSLSLAEARRALAGYEDRVSVAAEQGPDSVILSGAPEAIDAIVTRLKEDAIFCRVLSVAVASHSPQVEPLLPEFSPRPQGGGVTPVDQRAVFTAVVYVLSSGCAWRMLPSSFGVSVSTAHRRFTAWTKAGVWRRLHRAVLDELGAAGLIDWSRAVADAASVRAKRGAI